MASSPPTRTLYNVVRYGTNTTDPIPGGESGAPGGLNLEQFFGSTGWICTSTTAVNDVKSYGFLPLTSNCGTTN